MKKIIFVFFLLSSIVFANIGVGLKYGSDASLTILSDQFRVDIGLESKDLEHFSLSIDKMLRYDQVYLGLGLKTVNRDKIDIGGRIPIGLSLRASFIELFAELVPTYYLEKEFKLEYGLGFRIHF